MSTFSADWAALLTDAVLMPGVISDAYSRFWNYSIGNQFLAHWQCMVRSLEPGPINTFRGWFDLGRHVKKGEKALTLCMPVTVKSKSKPEESASDHERSPPETFTRYVYRPRWFLLSQTEGKEYVPANIPTWNETLALQTLQIERIDFNLLNGNTQGFALERKVSVSPIAALPHKTLLHELAHVVLGHTEELSRMDDHEHTPVNLREVEAEGVALICCESLCLPGTELCRGYIQHWLKGESIADRSAQKIFKAADQILKAGRLGPVSSEHL